MKKHLHSLIEDSPPLKEDILPDLRYLSYKQHFGKGFDSLWAIGYYCGSAGHVSQEAVKRYIQEIIGYPAYDFMR